jgi:hypothetical protein
LAALNQRQTVGSGQRHEKCRIEFRIVRSARRQEGREALKKITLIDTGQFRIPDTRAQLRSNLEEPPAANR